MTSPGTPCSCCRVVNSICYWGPRREARWKRPALAVCALPFLLGIPALAWSFWDSSSPWYFQWLGGLLFLMSVFGVAVSLVGCNACVARLLGEF